MSDRAQRRRAVTAADIAKAAGVSRATVGFVLNRTPGQTISEITRTRVLAESERLGYRPHRAAQALARGGTRVILLVLPDWPMDYSLRRNLEEASLALDEAGYSLVTYTPHEGGTARPLWEVLQPEVVLGMIPFSDEQISGITSSGALPILPGTADDVAGSTLAQGPRLQVRHLWDQGHTSIAFANSADPRVSQLAWQRRHLVTEEVRELGLNSPLVADLTLDPAKSRGVIQDWLDKGVSGVVAYNDDIAAVVHHVALRMGLGIPHELAIVGHDDAPIASLLTPALSSVRLDTAGLGRYFAALALSAARGEPRPEFDARFRPQLIVRESTVVS